MLKIGLEKKMKAQMSEPSCHSWTHTVGIQGALQARL